MTGLELIKIRDNHFGFKGIVDYWETKIKEVVVDGITYTNTTRDVTKKTIIELKKLIDFEIIDFDFDLLNYKIKIEDSIRRSLSTIAPCLVYSKNDNANLICTAFEKGILDDRILNVTCGKKGGKENWDSILKTSKVSIFLFSYGFNNSVEYTISIKTLFECDYELIPYDIKELFLKNGINLKSKNKLNQIINLINQKTIKL